jgi:hypothetical protein
MNTIWKNIVGDPKASETKSTEAAADPKAEVGNYWFEAAKVSFVVAMKDDKLTLTVPGQPVFTLQNIGGRRYKLGAPAPDGFFATFRPIKDKPAETELFLEQPQGNLVLPKAAAEKPADAVAAGTNGTSANTSLISTDELIAKMIAGARR